MPVRIESQAEPIPGYRLMERLGGGGFGEVWKAEAPGGMHKAIKFVYGDLETVDNEDTVRAHQELRSLERVKNIRHPFILSLERYEIVEGQLLIVSELADKSLWDRFRACRAQGLPGIPRAELLSYLTEAAEALDLMNIQYDLMHLDIKPQNLFLVHNHVKVADFGLVKDLEGLVASVTGGITPVYAAPETFDGYVSRFSDQYSLAIVFQELLTGVRPFSGTNTRQLILQHMQGKPKLDALPPVDRPVVARALSRDPNSRYPTCTEFIKALRANDPAVQSGGGTVTETMPNGATDIHTAPSSVKLPKDDLREGGGSGIVTPRPGGAAHTPFGAAPLSTPSTMVSPPTVRRIEQRGEGDLLPSLVIGLGALGRVAVHQLRQEFNSRLNNLASLPHIRTLCIDTDPETPEVIAGASSLSEELVLARLNRPARYLRPRDTLPPVENWLDINMIYRLPRNLATTGIRAFGRLALIEHYRSISARLRRELEIITDETTIAQGMEATGQNLRSNVPRIYLIAGLGGGTGSGMFLDLAFILRRQLRDLGFERLDVQAILLLPPVDERKDADIPQANALAALVELHHYQVSGQPFRAIYETNTEPVIDTQPPFSQITLLPLPDHPAHPQQHEVIRAVSSHIHRSLLTPLGKHADLARAGIVAPQPYNTLGLRVLSSPRRPLVRRLARRLSQDLLDLWLQPAQPAMEPKLLEHVRSHLQAAELDPQGIFSEFENTCTTVLGKRAESFFAELVAPFRRHSESGFPNVSKISEVFKIVEDLLGAPKDTPTTTLSQPRLIGALRDTAERIARTAGPPFIQGLLQFMDRPGFRIGGAEGAVRLAIQTLESWLVLYEGQMHDLEKQIKDTLDKFKSDLNEFEKLRARQDRKKALAMPPPGEAMLKCFMLRLNQFMHERLLGIYISLRGFCNDQVKDLRFCRTRLVDVQRHFKDVEDALATGPLPGIRQTSSILLPKGCRNLMQAVAQFLDTIAPADLAQLDQQIQSQLQRQSPPLAQLCMMPGDALRPVQALIQQEAERFLERRLPLQDAADLYLERQPDERALGDALLTTYDETLPHLLDQRVNFTGEYAILALPATPSGKKIHEAVRGVLPDLQTVSIPDADEIVLLRECVGVPLRDLKLFSSSVQAAYQTALNIEHFTPHTRQDVAAWVGPT
jgi:serine/threonine protein kinase